MRPCSFVARRIATTLCFTKKKDLNPIFKFLTVLLIFINSKALGQELFIGDVYTKLEPAELFYTKPIGKQKVTFIENHFLLTFDKGQLLNLLKIDSIQLDSTFKETYGIVINYLKTTDNIEFEYIWTGANDFDDISWFETEKLGARNLTKKILKEDMCNMINNGQFEIFEDGQRMEKYFFDRIHSNYGGNVKGVFSSSKRLIWICPPFIMD